MKGSKEVKFRATGAAAGASTTGANRRVSTGAGAQAARPEADQRLVDRCLGRAVVRLFWGGGSVAAGVRRGLEPARPLSTGRRRIMGGCRAAASSSPALAIAGLRRRARSAQKPAERGGPLRLGVDRALDESGLAQAACSTRSAPTPASPSCSSPAPALAVLEAVKQRRGRRRARSTRRRRRTALEQQGLVHDRRRDRRGRVHPRRAGAGGQRASAAAAAGTQRRRGARADPRPGRRPTRPASSSSPPATAPASMSPSRRSGGRRASRRRRPGTSPPSPAAASSAQVRARGAYALVERGAWTVARRRAARR